MNSTIKKKLSVLVVLILSNFLNAGAAVNYDTAWTFIYDGGVYSNGKSFIDNFYDIKIINDGRAVCVGRSGDSSGSTQSLLIKLDKSGQIVQKTLFNTTNPANQYNSQHAHSLFICRNNDLIIGGTRYLKPYIMRIDTLGNIKNTYWLFDSLNNKSLIGGSTINSVRETKRGTIICAAGEQFPNNGGSNLNNYAAYLEFDSTLNLIRYREWDNRPGYEIGGFNIEETKGGEYLLSGNKAVFYLDTSGAPKWQKSYTYQLEGTGSQVANIFRAKVLRDNTPVIIGQVYESDCWVNYQRYYHDAWWTPIRYNDGSIVSWDTAGMEAGNDIIYDFAQLVNGNLVFLGTKATVSREGIWVFVTDSTGEKFLWEKTVHLPGVDAGGFALTTLLPLSVCATPDSGFTLVGDNNTYGNNHNAFAMHFAPMVPVTNAPVINHSQPRPVMNTIITNSRVLFTCTGGSVNSVLAIYNIAGKRIASLRSSTSAIGSSSYVLNRSRISNGVYSYHLSSNSGLITGRFVLK